MKRVALYPGSFDPMTFGHLDILTRLAGMYDEVVAAVMINPAKKPYLTTEERVRGIEEATRHLGNVRAVAGSGATVELARKVGAQVMVRGLRSVTDFEYESTLAAGYHYMAPEIETVFMLSRPEYGYVSSSLVRDIHALGGDIQALVPTCIAQLLAQKAGAKGE